MTNLDQCQYCLELVKQINLLNENESKPVSISNTKFTSDGLSTSDNIKVENENLNEIKVELEDLDDPIAVRRDAEDPLDPDTKLNTKIEITEHLEENITVDVIESTAEESISVISNEYESCDIQEKKEKGSLMNHVQSAHNCVKFACNQCNKQFSSKGKLKRHVQSVHEGIKFNCDQCGKQFTQLDALKTHIESIHNGRKFVCDKCDQQFSQKYHLNRHIVSKHSLVL